MVAPLWALNTIKNLCSRKKWAKVHQIFFRRCYPLRSPIMPNFIEIGQTSFEKSVKNVTFSVLPDVFFCHGQKRDYFSRVSQRARGATKNPPPHAKRDLSSKFLKYSYSVCILFVSWCFCNKKHLKYVGPIRHCEPPHAHSPGVATVARAHRCPRRRRRQRRRVTEGTAHGE